MSDLPRLAHISASTLPSSKMPYKKIPDIPYVSSNPHPRQYLDLYIPISISTSTPPPSHASFSPPQSPHQNPLIIYIHGGAFKFGSKTTSLLPFRLLESPHHYAIASLDYRLSGDAIFPASVHDCKAAVRFLRANADKYGIKADVIVAMGESAGGHHVNMLGVTSSAASNISSTSSPGPGDFDVGEHLDQSSAVQGVVDYYGPSDFLQMDDHLVPDDDEMNKKSHIHLTPTSPESLYLGQDIRTCPEIVAKANPITYIEKETTCPFFIAHGTMDRVVSFHQSVILERALREKRVDVTFEAVEGADHVFEGMTEEQRVRLEGKTDAFLEKIFGR